MDKTRLRWLPPLTKGLDMPLPISEDHRALAGVARSFLQGKDALGSARAALNSETELLAPFWAEMCALGWAGLHVPEQYGGQGYGLEELTIVLEELGRVVAPAPLLATTLASAVLVRGASEVAKKEFVPGLADGSLIGAVGLGGGLTRDASGKVSGDAGMVLGGGLAQVLVLRVGDDLVVVERSAAGVSVGATTSLDPTVRFAAVTCAAVAVAPERIIAGGAALARRLARVLVSAEAVGGAAACLDMALAYAKVRVQFGRTIATFQAVKHHAADMLVHAELATAATWDAARHLDGDVAQGDLAAATAAALALPAYRFCAQKNIQLHGGIGFTWEHDAHLYLRRAQALSSAYGTAGEAETEVQRLVSSGLEREFTLDLPAEAEAFRPAAREAAARWRQLPEDARRDHLVESGYLMPHWPPPYGRAASAVEQLVIEEEFEGVTMPQMGITGWVSLTITQHGTQEQRDRWTDAALRGKDNWCQLFSEPDAGSDAAAIKTRGVRVDGGWLVTGQKVWTSGAQNSSKGFATVRTDFDGPKHAGVTMMVIEMQGPGVEVRPLREITGESMFNEVFFNDVFVPDDDVVGPVGQGWAVARATLGNERVSIGAGSRHGVGATELFPLAAECHVDDSGVLRKVAALVAEEHAMRLLNLRSAMRAVAGGAPGPEGNLTKLLSAEHAQRVTELAMDITAVGAVSGGQSRITFNYLFDRCLSIAGGTSEITRNQIAERILGLPRDPLAK